jgi:hypothetical protein
MLNIPFAHAEFIKYSKTCVVFATRQLSNTAKNVAKKLIFCLKCKVLCLVQIQHNITENHSSYIKVWWWLLHVIGMLVFGRD